MKYFYLKGRIEKELKIAKLGITIRNIDVTDKKKIKDEYNYLKKNSNMIDTIMNSYMAAAELQDKVEPKMIDILCQLITKMVKYKSNYNFDNDIEEHLDNIIIIQFDEKLEKYFDDDELIPFVQKILGLNDVFCSNMVKDRLNYENKNLKVCDYPEIDILIDYITIGDIDNLYEIDNLSYEFLVKLSHFISKINIENLERFIDVVELIYLDPKTNQNCIISNVLSIESMILSDTKNIEKNFVLKAGIILKENNFPFTNEQINCILNFIYNIRSDIVHGNPIKVKADYDRLESKIPNSKIILEDSKVIYSKKKDMPYAIANVYSNIVLFNVINYWILNTDKLEYIKQN